jgi:hypothetical protein
MKVVWFLVMQGLRSCSNREEKEVVSWLGLRYYYWEGMTIFLLPLFSFLVVDERLLFLLVDTIVFTRWPLAVRRSTGSWFLVTAKKENPKMRKQTMTLLSFQDGHTG